MSAALAATLTNFENQWPAIRETVWPRLPDSVDYNGQTYRKADVQTARQGAWYLAALSMRDPAGVAKAVAAELDAQGFDGNAYLDAEQLDAEQLDAEQLDAEQLDAEQLDAEQLDAEQFDPYLDNAGGRPSPYGLDAANVTDNTVMGCDSCPYCGR